MRRAVEHPAWRRECARRVAAFLGGDGVDPVAVELEDGWKSSALDGSGLLCDRDAWVRVTDEAKSRRSGLH